LTDQLVYTLAIDPSTPSTLYAGTTRGGVFKSTDSGASWTNVGLTLWATTVYALAIGPSTPSTIYAGTNGGVFQSTNGGGGWTNVGFADQHVAALAIDPSTPSTLYAGTLGGGVFQSTDSGASWSAVNTGLTDLNVRALAIDPSTPGTLYAGTNLGGVFDIEPLPLAPGPTVTPAPTPPPAIPGGGKNGCLLEWITEPPTLTGPNGLPVHQLTCVDDNSQCDFGATTGDNACTFHVGLCLNVADARSGCLYYPTVAQVQLRSPDEANPKDAVAEANRDALENALEGLGGAVRGLCANRGPHKGELCIANADCDSAAGSGNGLCRGRFVAFVPPLSAESMCTASASIQVPLRQGVRAASATLNVKAISDAGQKGHNSLRLSCKPHA